MVIVAQVSVSSCRATRGGIVVIGAKGGIRAVGTERLDQPIEGVRRNDNIGVDEQQQVGSRLSRQYIPAVRRPQRLTRIAQDNCFSLVAYGSRHVGGTVVEKNDLIRRPRHSLPER